MSNKGKVDLNNLGDYVIDTSALEDVSDTSDAKSSSQVAMPSLEPDPSSAVKPGTAAVISAQQWPTTSTGGQESSQQQRQLQASRKRQKVDPQPAGRNTTRNRSLTSTASSGRGAAGPSSSMEAALVLPPHLFY
eukprot:jgi/Bigna1/69700/fgenesh1_pg.9_\